MKQNQKRVTTVTEKRIASPKFLHLLCALLGLALDVGVMIALINNSIELKFLICPALIALLDLVFIVKAIFSNYRFRYAINGMILHVVMIALISIYAYVSAGILEERVVFVTFALYAMPAVHLIHCVAVLLTALQAAKVGKTFQKLLAVVMTLLFVGSSAIYGRFLLTDGFFGQGVNGEELVVTYEYNEATDTYTATGALKGRGDTVVIPETFNGLAVTAVDCKLFTETAVDTVRLECAKDISFRNPAELSEMNTEMKILAPRESFDAFRDTLYTLSKTNATTVELANHMEISDLGSNEVCVVFRYTADELKYAKYNTLPTWVAQKGTVLDLGTYAEDYFYLKHADVNSAEDLYQCFTKQDGYIFRGIRNSAETDIDKLAVTENVDVSLKFSKIYCLKISEDNDDVYTVKEDYRFLECSDGVQQYRLALAEQVGGILTSMEQRPGFEFQWKIGQNHRTLENLATELQALDKIYSNTLELHPFWSMKLPEITTLTADGVSENHVAIYGNDVSLAATATSPDPSISLSYQWVRDGAEIGAGQTHTIVKLQPEDQGDYLLKVTASAPAISSLQQEVEQQITVGFQKRELPFSWVLPPDTVYDATDKPIGVVYQSTSVLEGDAIEYQLSTESVKNANTYNLSVSLIKDADRKYQIPLEDQTNTITITPRTVEVTWSGEENFEYVYSGATQGPTAAATGVGEDGAITLTVTGQGKNAGDYTATAVCGNSNYQFSNPTKGFSVTKRPITIEGWTENSLVYNGKEQIISVTDVANVVSGENSTVLSSLTYEGKATNVGDYAAVASLPASSNYRIEGSSAQAFSITPKALTITVQDKTVTYSGVPTDPSQFSVAAEGLVSTDSLDRVAQLTYVGEATTAVNANTEAYQIGATYYELTNNYTITVVPGRLTINKRALTVKLTDATKVYDGKIYPTASFGFTHDGLAVTDTIDQVLTLTYTGSAVSAIHAGSDYTLSADQVQGEKYENYKITLETATLKIEKAPLTVSALNATKVYDNKIGGEFRYTVDGLVEGETVDMLGAPIFGGNAKTLKNVGEHSLTISMMSDYLKNYEVTYVPAVFTITKRPLTVTVQSGSKIYDAKVLTVKDFDFDVDGLAENDLKSMLGNPVFSGNALNAKDVDVYSITITKLEENTTNRNYDITYIGGEYTIKQREITITATAISKVYDGKEGGNFTFTATNMPAGETVAVLGTPTFSDAARYAREVGEYPLSVSVDQHRNYLITEGAATTFTITKRPLVIRAEGGSKTYDGMYFENFDFSITSGSLAEGDTKELLGLPNYSGDAYYAINVGIYSDLEVYLTGNAVNSNYEITYQKGQVIILQKKLTITALAENRTYDGTEGGEFFFIVDGLVAGETEASLGTPNWAGTAVNAKNVGSYSLTVSFDAPEILKNYSVTTVPASFVISKKTLNITVIATDKIYNGEASGEFDFYADGLAMGDTKEMLGTPNWGGNAVGAVNVGDYTLTLASFRSGTVTGNYELQVTDDTFTISKAPLTVTAKAADRVYDGKNGGSFTIEVEGLVGRDTVAKLGTATYCNEAQQARNVGEYTLKVNPFTGVTAENYDITYHETHFNITPRTGLKVTAIAVDRSYDSKKVGGSFSFTVSGLVSGDSSALLGEATYGGTAVTAKEVGTYVLTVRFENSDPDFLKNYADIEYVNDNDFRIVAVETN